MSRYTNATYKDVEAVLIGLCDTFGHNLINFTPLCLQKNIRNNRYTASLTQPRFRLNTTIYRLK